jgi:hypothetical protein
MKKSLFTCFILIFMAAAVNGQKTPAGNPDNFRFGNLMSVHLF